MCQTSSKTHIQKNPPQNISLYLHAKSDILEDIGNALHEASAGIVVVGFVSNIFTNIAERRWLSSWIRSFWQEWCFLSHRWASTTAELSYLQKNMGRSQPLQRDPEDQTVLWWERRIHLLSVNSRWKSPSFCYIYKDIGDKAHNYDACGCFVQHISNIF